MPKMKGKVLGKATAVVLTQAQHVKLKEYTTGQGGHQNLCQKVYDSAKLIDGKLLARIYEADMERIRRVIDRPDQGGWQDLFREIMASNR